MKIADQIVITLLYALAFFTLLGAWITVSPGGWIGFILSAVVGYVCVRILAKGLINLWWKYE